MYNFTLTFFVYLNLLLYPKFIVSPTEMKNPISIQRVKALTLNCLMNHFWTHNGIYMQIIKPGEFSNGRVYLVVVWYLDLIKNMYAESIDHDQTQHNAYVPEHRWV